MKLWTLLLFIYYVVPSSKCIHDPIIIMHNSITMQYRYRGKSPHGDSCDDVRICIQNFSNNYCPSQ